MHLCKSVLDLHLQQKVLAVTAESAEMNEYFDERSYLKDLTSENLWLSLNPKLYTIFWYLNLQSMLVPEGIYADQIKKIQKQVDDVGASQQKSQAEKLKKQKQKLEEEKIGCLQEAKKVDLFLKANIHACFEGIDEQQLTHISTMLIQHCFLPRILFSPQDALYSIHFLKMLHA